MRKLIEDLGDIIDGKRAERIDESLEMDASASLAALDALLQEESETEKTITALRDTDYRDKDAFFKMVQLLKGLATSVDEDETSKKFMSAVSDALTSAAKKVLGEDEEDDDGNMEEAASAIGSDASQVRNEVRDAKEMLDLFAGYIDRFHKKGRDKKGLRGAAEVMRQVEDSVRKLNAVLKVWQIGDIKEEKRPSQASIRIFSGGGYGEPKKYNFSVKERDDSGKESLTDKGTGKTAKQAFEKAMKVCKDEYGWE